MEQMDQTTVIKRRTFWFSMLAISAAAGSLLWAADGLLSKEELKTRIVNAKTVTDHERLAKHFDAKADQLEAESKEHQDLAAKYKANPTMHEQKHPMSGQTVGHCKYFADDLHKAAQSARQMAADHREMAKASK